MQLRPASLSLVYTLALLTSCTPGPASRPDGSTVNEDTQLAYTTNTWKSIEGDSLPAVRELVSQADRSIAINDYDVAAEKLERALRISHDDPVVWSRLSQIALYEQKPSRAIQMAKRSNSFAAGMTDLKRVNWEFIRQASSMLNDTAGIDRANAALQQLEKH